MPFEKITGPWESESGISFTSSPLFYPVCGRQTERNDASAFSMVGVPTLALAARRSMYTGALTTRLGPYTDVLPYARHQEHTALAMAVMAYGIANLDHRCRAHVYLPDGIYADITTAKGRIIVAWTMITPRKPSRF